MQNCGENIYSLLSHIDIMSVSNLLKFDNAIDLSSFMKDCQDKLVTLGMTTSKSDNNNLMRVCLKKMSEQHPDAMFLYYEASSKDFKKYSSSTLFSSKDSLPFMITICDGNKVLDLPKCNDKTKLSQYQQRLDAIDTEIKKRPTEEQKKQSIERHHWKMTAWKEYADNHIAEFLAEITKRRKRQNVKNKDNDDN